MKGDPEMCGVCPDRSVHLQREQHHLLQRSSGGFSTMGSPRWTAVCSVLTLTDWLTNESFQPWPCWHLWRLVEDLQHVGAHHWRIWAERRSRIQRALPSRLLATCVTYRTYDRGNSSFQRDRPAAFSFDFRVQHNQKCPVENCGVVF